jgi:hypothetical protein
VIGSALVVAAYAVALEVHDAWEETCFEVALAAECGSHVSDWPVGRCVEVSVALRDELAERLPQVRPFYVWGSMRGEPLGVYGHAWVSLGDEPDAPWLDVTARQFTGVCSALAAHLDDGPVALVLADDPARGVWRPQSLLAPGCYENRESRELTCTS